jgi:hypothetical protein
VLVAEATTLGTLACHPSEAEEDKDEDKEEGESAQQELAAALRDNAALKKELQGTQEKLCNELKDTQAANQILIKQLGELKDTQAVIDEKSSIAAAEAVKLKEANRDLSKQLDEFKDEIKNGLQKAGGGGGDLSDRQERAVEGVAATSDCDIRKVSPISVLVAAEAITLGTPAPHPPQAEEDKDEDKEEKEDSNSEVPKGTQEKLKDTQAVISEEVVKLNETLVEVNKILQEQLVQLKDTQAVISASGWPITTSAATVEKVVYVEVEKVVYIEVPEGGCHERQEEDQLQNYVDDLRKALAEALRDKEVLATELENEKTKASVSGSVDEKKPTPKEQEKALTPATTEADAPCTLPLDMDFADFNSIGDHEAFQKEVTKDIATAANIDAKQNLEEHAQSPNSLLKPGNSKTKEGSSAPAPAVEMNVRLLEYAAAKSARLEILYRTKVEEFEQLKNKYNALLEGPVSTVIKNESLLGYKPRYEQVEALVPLLQQSQRTSIQLTAAPVVTTSYVPPPPQPSRSNGIHSHKSPQRKILQRS